MYEGMRTVWYASLLKSFPFMMLFGYGLNRHYYFDRMLRTDEFDMSRLFCYTECYHKSRTCYGMSHIKQFLSIKFCRFFMHQKLRPRTELRVFVKCNRIYLLIGAICLILCIKQSEAPFFWKYNAFTSFLFQRPEENTGWGSAFFLIYELGLAFLASFLFYLLVDYFPRRRRERSAFLLVLGELEVIDAEIGRLFAFLMFYTGVGTCVDQLMPDHVETLCGITLRDEEVYCHTRDIQTVTGEVLMEGNPDHINLFFGLKEMSEVILRQVDGIMGLPYAANLEDELLQLLTRLKGSRMLNLLSGMQASYIQVDENMGFICNYFPEDVIHLYFTYLQLQCFPYPKRLVIVEQSDPDSIKQAEEEWERVKREFPQSTEFLEKLRKGMGENQQ